MLQILRSLGAKRINQEDSFNSGAWISKCIDEQLVQIFQLARIFQFFDTLNQCNLHHDCILSVTLDTAVISLRVNSRPIHLQVNENSFAEMRKAFLFLFWSSNIIPANLSLSPSRRWCQFSRQFFRLTRTDRNNSVVGACSQTKRDNSVIGLR